MRKLTPLFLLLLMAGLSIPGLAQTTFTPLYQQDYTSQSNAATPAAGGTVGAAPASVGTSYGPMVDVNGGKWSVNGGTLADNRTAPYSAFSGLLNPVRVPVGVIGVCHVREYGSSGDIFAPILHLRTSGSSGSDGLILSLQSSHLIVWQSSGYTLINTPAGVTLSSSNTLDVALRPSTASEATTLGVATGTEIIAYNIGSGNSTTWVWSGIVAESGIPATGYIEIGDRLTVLKTLLVEKAAPSPLTVSALRCNTSLSTSTTAVFEADVTGQGAGDTLRAALNYSEGVTSTPVSVSTLTATGTSGTQTLRFSAYTPPDTFLHYYSATITDSTTSASATTTNYLAGYQNGQYAGIPMPYAVPVPAVPGLAAISAPAQAAVGSAIGIAMDSRGGGISITPFSTVSGNGSLALVNGSVGGTGSAEWSPAYAGPTMSPIAGQTSNNMWTGLKNATLAAGGKWIIFLIGTNNPGNVSDDPVFQQQYRAAVTAWVAAGLNVFIMPDDGRIYPNLGMQYMLNHDYFMQSLADNVHVFSGDLALDKYWKDNVSTLSVDGVHWNGTPGYTNRNAFIAAEWGQAVTKSVGRGGAISTPRHPGISIGL